MTETRDFQLQTTQMHEASCLFSFKSILLRTSGKCKSIKRTACMLNFGTWHCSSNLLNRAVNTGASWSAQNLRVARDTSDGR